MRIGLKRRCNMLAVAVALSLICFVVVLPGAAEAQYIDQRYIDQYTDVASVEADQNAVMNTEPATNTPANIPAAAEPAAVSETSEPVVSAAGASPVMPEASWLNERRLIGLGIIVLTLALAILILWKMPMRRNLGSRNDNTWAAWAAVNPVEVEQENPLEDRGRYLQPDLYDVPEEQRVMYINQIMDVTGATAPFSPAATSFEPPQVPEMPMLGIQEEEIQRQVNGFRQRIEELTRRYE